MVGVGPGARHWARGPTALARAAPSVPGAAAPAVVDRRSAGGGREESAPAAETRGAAEMGGNDARPLRSAMGAEDVVPLSAAVRAGKLAFSAPTEATRAASRLATGAASAPRTDPSTPATEATCAASPMAATAAFATADAVEPRRDGAPAGAAPFSPSLLAVPAADAPSVPCSGSPSVSATSTARIMALSRCSFGFTCAGRSTASSTTPGATPSLLADVADPRPERKDIATGVPSLSPLSDTATAADALAARSRIAVVRIGLPPNAGSGGACT
jgi:hypothetical protein